MTYDLQNNITPKMEMPHNSTLELYQNVLPAIASWEVGRDYLLKLRVHAVSKEKGSLIDPKKKKFKACFFVTGGEALDSDKSPKKVKVKELKESRSRWSPYH